MPVSSAEIAQMAMQNYQQVALMGSMYSGYGSPDRMAGHAMNAVGSIGSGAMDMMKGIPMALGMQAGMSAFGAGAGLTGALGAGMGVAGAAAIPLGIGAAAFGYAGHQMMQGAQDQQQLNATLSGSFRHYNQQGGRGFGRGEMSSIGGAMREMSHEVGQGGELTSMRELTDLAGKMGQMGMGRGIKDAKEFNTKFRELVKTVKEVATELNTSLSQAMEFMGAAKSSGVFGKTSQAQFAGLVRNTAVSSNLATSEVTSMANIGSQISRSFGGLGRQGAIGGMKAIGDVGAAMQAGVMSEEDVYNATGMSGAEGRQAMASNMMAQSGSFLKSGKGRWFLASVAGRDGTLDEEDAARYMRGGLGVGDTRGMAHKNLGEVGRANFIRNEGRLRGAAMEKFGGMIPAMALMGWASQKGVDINDMDDRSMLFAQRQLGMGRDELDQAVKMASNMPAIARQQAGAQQDADHARRIGLDLKHKGVEGLKRRFEHAKEGINSKLKETGQEIYSETAQYVERFMNELLEHTVTATTDNLGSIYRTTLLGGASGKSLSNAVFGGGRGGLDAVLSSKLKTTGGGGSGAMGWTEFSGTGGMSGALSGSGRYRKQFEEAGFGFGDIEGMRPGKSRNDAMNSRIGQLDNMRKLMNGPIGAMDISSDTKGTLLDIYTSGGVATAKPLERPAALRKALEEKSAAGDKEARALLMKFGNGEASDLMLTAQIEGSIGKNTGGVKEAFEKIGDTTAMFGSRGKFHTLEESDKFVGRRLTGTYDAQEHSLMGTMARRGAGGALVGVGIGGPFGAIPGAIVGAVVGAGKGAHDWFKQEGLRTLEKSSTDAGRYLRSEEGLRHGSAILGDDPVSKKQAVVALMEKVANDPRKEGETLKDGENQAAAVLLSMNDYGTLMSEAKAAGRDVTDKEKAAMVDTARKRGLGIRSFADLQVRMTAAYGDLGTKQRANYEKQMASVRVDRGNELERVTREHGVLTQGDDGKLVLSADADKKLGANVTARAVMGSYAEEMSLWKRSSAARMSGDLKSSYTDEAAASRIREGRLTTISGMTIAEMKAGEEAAGTSSVADDFAFMRSGTKQVESLKKGGRGRAGGVGFAAAALLGISVDKKTRENLNAAFSGKGSDEDALKALADASGLEGSAKQKFMESKESMSMVSGLRKGTEAGSNQAQLASKQLLSTEGGNKDIAKALEKQAEKSKGPQDKMVDSLKNIETAIKTMDASFTNFPTNIAAQFKEAMPGIVAAIKGESK
jgi:hypothetical protein